MSRSQTKRTVASIAGGVIGGVLGVIVAINLVIYLGVEGGYEASLGDVFTHSPLLGWLVIMVLVGGPIMGVIVARRRRGGPEV